MTRTLTQNKISDFYTWLKSEEKSKNTIEKYIRDVTAFMSHLGGVVIGCLLIAFDYIQQILR